MPICEFMYAGKLYDKFIHSAKLNRHGKKLLPLPLPKLVVFYNGEDEKEDEIILSLSNAFREEIRQNIMHRHSENKDKPNDAEVSAEVERVFQEASPDIEIFSACKPLEEYAHWIQ